MSEQNKIIIKIVAIGSSYVGKTSILQRMIDNSFGQYSNSFYRCELAIKNIEKHGQLIKLQFWDTCGQERFRTLSSFYYKNVNGLLFVYNITERQTFEDVQNQISQFYHRKQGIQPMCILIGNKSDLEKDRQVQFKEGLDLANQNGLFFLETSALTGQNIDYALDSLIDLISQVN